MICPKLTERPVCWGADTYNQITGTPTENGFVAVDGGNDHTCAINASGHIECWGRNDFGQAADGPD